MKRPRTAAATAANRQRKAENLCAELVDRLDALPEPILAAVTVKLLAECQRRGGAR
ncbi:hypothetical protein Raf01_52460 [Rugosimonospora africana]|uniref:Uncharacterized protein n=1 Tax=Rugosimonospora africana TaxID=556532 RepID=A0A8J3QU07_9ACTN|nr:hypothetical protein Raf01_52460 [Rugosimonospora africana]